MILMLLHLPFPPQGSSRDDSSSVDLSGDQVSIHFQPFITLPPRVGGSLPSYLEKTSTQFFHSKDIEQPGEGTFAIPTRATFLPQSPEALSPSCLRKASGSKPSLIGRELNFLGLPGPSKSYSSGPTL